MNYPKMLLAAAALSLSYTACAEKPDELRYSFVNLTLTKSEIEDAVFEDSDLDFDSFTVTGSIAASENLAVIGSIGVAATDDVCLIFVGCDEIEETSISVGIAPHFPIANNVDVVIPLSFLRVDAEVFDEDEDDTGYSAGLGIRALLNPSLEVEAGVTHIDIFDDDDQTYSGQIRWHMTELYSMSLGLNKSDDTSGISLGARFTF